MGNHSQSCKYAGTFFVHMYVSAKIPDDGTGGLDYIKTFIEQIEYIF